MYNKNNSHCTRCRLLFLLFFLFIVVFLLVMVGLVWLLLQSQFITNIINVIIVRSTVTYSGKFLCCCFCIRYIYTTTNTNTQLWIRLFVNNYNIVSLAMYKIIRIVLQFVCFLYKLYSKLLGNSLHIHIHHIPNLIYVCLWNDNIQHQCWFHW